MISTGGALKSQDVGVGKGPVFPFANRKPKHRKAKQFACGHATHWVAESQLESKTSDSQINELPPVSCCLDSDPPGLYILPQVFQATPIWIPPSAFCTVPPEERLPVFQLLGHL